MSRMPGIASEWFKRFHRDVYANKKDFITLRGVKMKPPKFYDRLLKNLFYWHKHHDENTIWSRTLMRLPSKEGGR